MRTVSKLAPDLFDFTQDGMPGMSPTLKDRTYTYHPQPIETYLIIWRLTHNPKYRKWGSEILDRMIEKFKNADFDDNKKMVMGTANVMSKIDRNEVKANNDLRVQQNHVLAETFKVSLNNYYFFNSLIQ